MTGEERAILLEELPELRLILMKPCAESAELLLQQVSRLHNQLELERYMTAALSQHLRESVREIQRLKDLHAPGPA
jgi:hypothetical protein